MVHYPELAESKGLVLMVGEYDKDVLVSLLSSLQSLSFYDGLTRIVFNLWLWLQTESEARCLVVQTLQYYGWAKSHHKKFGHLFRFSSWYYLMRVTGHRLGSPTRRMNSTTLTSSRN